MGRVSCPLCGKKLIEPSGPEDADIILVGARPGWEEIAKGVPWIGKAGKVLEAELAKQGIQRQSCRVTNLWLHEPPPPGTPKKPNPEYARELEWHFERLLKEVKGRKYVFLMGAEPCEVLKVGNVMDVSGLQVSSEYFHDQVCIASPNPAIVLHGESKDALVGEIRLAFSRFAELVS